MCLKDDPPPPAPPPILQIKIISLKMTLTSSTILVRYWESYEASGRKKVRLVFLLTNIFVIDIGLQL